MHAIQHVSTSVRETLSVTSDGFHPYDLLVWVLNEAQLLSFIEVDDALNEIPKGGVRSLQSVPVRSVQVVRKDYRLRFEDFSSYYKMSLFEAQSMVLSMRSPECAASAPTVTGRMFCPWSFQREKILRSKLLQEKEFREYWPRLFGLNALRDVPPDQRIDWSSEFIGTFFLMLIDRIKKAEASVS